ncbi:unnamed protein product [Nyctereutes procyonoides]|uniref:(raccoon dog) hypothetical protein n=1 Tax=Nyctereutes procyonoides TaxID=34880 RepID=A0A811YXM8_NYCPR|nr:unnamed protein product [Nyctereutes procyonoides]
MLCSFYGKNSYKSVRMLPVFSSRILMESFCAELDSNGKPVETVYGQKEIHRKVMSQNLTNCHTKIHHIDADATLSDGVVVEVTGLLSNNDQALRRLMETFVLAPKDLVANEKTINLMVVLDGSGTFYDQTVSKDLEEHLEEPVAESEPDPEPEQEPESESKRKRYIEEIFPSTYRHGSDHPERLENIFWGICDLPPSGAVAVTGIPPHVVKVPTSQPHLESKSEAQIPPQRPQKDQKKGPRPIPVVGKRGDFEPQRTIRHPDSHQPLHINSGWKLPHLECVVFDDSEPHSNRPIMFRGEVCLNEEEKSPAAQKGDRGLLR